MRSAPATGRSLSLAVQSVSAPVEGAAEASARVVRLVEGVAALDRHLDTPLIGRKRELGALAAVFERVADERRCRLLLMLGEPGIGKTRLTAEFTARLATRPRC